MDHIIQNDHVLDGRVTMNDAWAYACNYMHNISTCMPSCGRDVSNLHTKSWKSIEVGNVIRYVRSLAAP